MKPIKILLILVHSSMNIGDRAILESTIDRLKAVFIDPQITILSNYPNEPYFESVVFSIEPSPWVVVGMTAGKSMANQLLRFFVGIGWVLLAQFILLILNVKPNFVPAHWRRLIKTYMNADIVIGSGGNQFYSSGKFGWPFPLNAMSVWLAHLFRKPFYAMPQSIGPFKRKWEQRVMVYLYKRNRKTYLRDLRSMQLAQKIGLNNVEYAPDLAFRPVDTANNRAVEILNQYGYDKTSNKVGMTIIAPMGLSLNQQQVDYYYENLVLLIERMIKSFDCDVYIFRQVSGPSKLENDGLANLLVYNNINSTFRERVYLINKDFSPNVLIGLYQQMDLFIASRLHSGIFSLCCKVPTVFIGYLSKTLGVLESLELETYGIELSEIEPEKLWTVVNKAWESKEGFQLIIEPKLSEIFSQTNKVVANVFADYEESFA